MTLDEAMQVVHERSLAAASGPLGMATCSGGPAVHPDAAGMLLAGVAADPGEVLAALRDGASSVLLAVARGDDPLGTLQGALLETFVLGSLVGRVPDA